MDIESQMLSSISNLRPNTSSEFLSNLQLLNDSSFLRSNAHHSKNSEILSIFYSKLAIAASSLDGDLFSGKQIIRFLSEFNWEFYCEHSSVVEEYTKAIAQLCTSYPNLIKPIFSSVASWLGGGSPWDKVRDEKESQNKQKVFPLIHSFVRKICSCIPLSVKELYLALVKGFPFQTQTPITYRMYSENLLLVTEYIPTLRKKLLSFLIRKLIEMDIEIGLEDEHFVAQALFRFIAERSNSFDEEISGFISKVLFVKKDIETEKPSDEDGCTTEKQDVRSNLNETLFVLLEYIKRHRKDSEIIYIILSEFDNQILPNKFLKFTPFIIFFVAYLSLRYQENLIRLLLDRLNDRSRPVKLRCNSVSYLSGILLHSNFVKKFTVTKTFELLVQWAFKFAKQNEPKFLKIFNFDCRQREMVKSTPIETSEALVFYSIFEAIISIFVFRHKEISNSLTFKNTLTKMDTLMHSKLSFLRFCSKEMVLCFSAFAYSTGMVDVFPILLCCYRYYRLNRHCYYNSKYENGKKFFTKDKFTTPFAVPLCPEKFKFLNEFYISKKSLSNYLMSQFSFDDEEIENLSMETESEENFFGGEEDFKE